VTACPEPYAFTFAVRGLSRSFSLVSIVLRHQRALRPEVPPGRAVRP